MLPLNPTAPLPVTGSQMANPQPPTLFTQENKTLNCLSQGPKVPNSEVLLFLRHHLSFLVSGSKNEGSSTAYPQAVCISLLPSYLVSVRSLCLFFSVPRFSSLSSPISASLLSSSYLCPCPSAAWSLWLSLISSHPLLSLKPVSTVFASPPVSTSSSVFPKTSSVSLV